MASPVGELYRAAPLTEGLGGDRKPSVKIDSPFNLDGLQWTPVSITVQSETVEIESPFTRIAPVILLSGSGGEVRSQEVPRIEGVIISRYLSYQTVVCAPFGVKGRQVPKSYDEFKTLVLETMSLFDPSYLTLEWREVSLPNNRFFSLELSVDPAPIIEVKRVVDGREHRIMSSAHGGVVIRAEATSKAVYLLIDKSNSKTPVFTFKVK